MSDLFHEQVPDSFIFNIFDIMKQAYWHQFQILTKRSARLIELASRLDWPKNVWIGVSVENEAVQFRIDDLRWVPAAIRFLSFEPLLGPIASLDLSNINWAIVGGESGPGARSMKKEWVIQIKEQCIEQNVPFFFKQWGGINKKKTGRLLEARTWDEMPIELVDLEEEIEYNESLHLTAIPLAFLSGR
jgi:protein gp37